MNAVPRSAWYFACVDPLSLDGADCRHVIAYENAWIAAYAFYLFLSLLYFYNRSLA